MADLIKTVMDQAVTVLPLASRAPGTYTIPVQVSGPAMYSTIWYRGGAGSSLKVNWYEITTGIDGDERYDLDSHPLLLGNASPQHSRIAVSRMQGFPRLEAIVSGGSAEFGVMVKCVRDFPFEFDASTLDIDVAPPLTSMLVENATIAAADVEQSHTFPASTKSFMIQARGNGKIKLASSMGNSGTIYHTIWAGAYYATPEPIGAPSTTIFFQSPVLGLVIELTSWT